MRPTARRSNNRGGALRLLLFGLFVLTACGARETPPQLGFTPGPPYTLTDRLLTTNLYTVETPLDWRVIAGPAEDPYTFQFIAPDNAALIVLSDHAVVEPPTPLGAAPETVVQIASEVQVAGRTLYVVLVGARTDALLTTRDALAASLR